MDRRKEVRLWARMENLSSLYSRAHVRGALKKYAEFFNFFLISIYNEFTFQHNLRHG